jgi:histidine triad (HIT) family protein
MKFFNALFLLFFLSDAYASEVESVFSKKSKSSWVLESENAFVLEDKYPQAPIHLLVVSKEIIQTVNDAPSALLGEMLELAKNAAQKYNIDKSGFRIVINTSKEGGQGVYHLHIHILGGRQMQWPPG